MEFPRRNCGKHSFLLLGIIFLIAYLSKWVDQEKNNTGNKTLVNVVKSALTHVVTCLPVPGDDYFRHISGRRSFYKESLKCWKWGFPVWSRGSHDLQELGLGLHSRGTWTYLDSFAGVLQLADHSLHSIIVSHEASNAVAELRLMKRKEGRDFSSQHCPWSSHAVVLAGSSSGGWGTLRSDSEAREAHAMPNFGNKIRYWRQ